MHEMCYQINKPSYATLVWDCYHALPRHVAPLGWSQRQHRLTQSTSTCVNPLRSRASSSVAVGWWATSILITLHQHAALH